MNWRNFMGVACIVFLLALSIAAETGRKRYISAPKTVYVLTVSRVHEELRGSPKEIKKRLRLETCETRIGGNAKNPRLYLVCYPATAQR